MIGWPPDRYVVSERQVSSSSSMTTCILMWTRARLILLRSCSKLWSSIVLFYDCWFEDQSGWVQNDDGLFMI